ncbi:hypothetical protein [Shimia biformata]|uniref:hypothetical protein n=1 Tax=Shimia biformata TaxID=1294299 RepID=UPI001951462E|nr:hypothetical protein [Shimia biformata]
MTYTQLPAGTRRFGIKPALLRTRRYFDLTEDGLACRSRDGTLDWQVAWPDLTRVVFVDHHVERQLMWRLDLICGDTVRRIAINIPEQGAKSDPDLAEFVDLIAGISEALAAARPEMRVSLGEYGRAKWGMLAVGVLSAVTGLGVLIAALVGGVSTDRMAAAAVPMLLLMALGALVIRAHHPWQSAPEVPAASFAPILRAWEMHR